MQKKWLVILFSSLLYSTLALASSSIQPVISLSGGIAPLNTQNSDSFENTHNTFIYTPGSPPIPTIGGAFVGAEIGLPQWAIQTGVAFNYLWPFSVAGIHTVGNNPAAATAYNYHYKINSQQVMWETKLLADWQQHYHPYIVLDLGAGFNRSYNYSITTGESNPNTTLNYTDHNNTSFVYGGGFGLDVDVISHLRVGAGLRVFDLGPANVGSATWTPTINNPVTVAAPSLTHLYVTEVLVQVAYLF